MAVLHYKSYAIKKENKIMSTSNNDMSTAVANIRAFEDGVNRLCDYQSQMNSTYLNIIDSIRILMSHGVEKECSTIDEYIQEFKAKFPDSTNSYALQLLAEAGKRYDEFYKAFSDGEGKFQHATIRGLVNAARIYKELEKDMFYDRGVKFDFASDPSFIAVSKLDLY